MASIVRTLDTGDYLRYVIEASDGEQTIVVNSYYNVGRSSCLVRLADSTVIANVYRE